MTILNISIVLFIVMESANVAILYFMPDSKLGNGVAVFNPWFSAKNDQASELFAKYMVNWVAGTKIIFIALLIVILLVGNEATKAFAVFAMIATIATYFWRLHPIIKQLDEMGEITPKGYSKGLFMMIVGFMVMFSLALGAYLIF